MQLFGKDWTRREIEARVGRMEQLGGVRRMQLTEGPEAGVEIIQVSTGAGLTYYVSPSRGLDISLAKFRDVPISWKSPNGDVAPAFYNAGELEWLRTAAGGLLMTCGLSQVGSPNEDGGEKLGLHGRIHHTPARHVSAGANWRDDDYELRVSGMAEETKIFGDCLRLTRSLISRMGENRIEIHDEVENVGFRSAPHMMLYHFNFGFPLLMEETRIKFPSAKVTPREETTPLAGFDQWQAPTIDYQERVYYHTVISSRNHIASVEITNPIFPLGSGNGATALCVRISWNTEQLPRLVQWKMPGAGVHVLGIEPANCWVEGRAVERQRGTLVQLNPGEKKFYDLEIEILDVSES
ncbi:MAG: aldose 1-epimerase family protein [Candidatus Zhuqueibacterota bacterium]